MRCLERTKLRISVINGWRLVTSYTCRHFRYLFRRIFLYPSLSRSHLCRRWIPGDVESSGILQRSECRRRNASRERECDAGNGGQHAGDTDATW